MKFKKKYIIKANQIKKIIDYLNSEPMDKENEILEILNDVMDSPSNQRRKKNGKL